MTADAAGAVAQLRHLYAQMLDGSVRDTAEAARGLLGPAIERLERATPPTATAPSRAEVVEAIAAYGAAERADAMVTTATAGLRTHQSVKDARAHLERLVGAAEVGERKPSGGWRRTPTGKLVLAVGERELAHVLWQHHDTAPWFWEALDEHGRADSEEEARRDAEAALDAIAAAIRGRT